MLVKVENNKLIFDEKDNIKTTFSNENIIKILANKFIKDYGAPNLQIALPVAKEEIEFMNSICEEHPDNTLLMVSREFTAKGIREKFRHIQANDAELEAFAIHGSTE